jgi:hypothetical protein
METRVFFVVRTAFLSIISMIFGSKELNDRIVTFQSSRRSKFMVQRTTKAHNDAVNILGTDKYKTVAGVYH